MAKVVRVHEYGGPEAMIWEDAEVPKPGAGEAHIKHTAVGLNFIDVYHRTGLYPQPSLPFVPGTEAAGEVLAIGEGVTNVRVGDRVAYASVVGSYSQERIIVAERLVKLPDNIDDKTAAASMLQGMTARYLLRKTYVVKSGDTILCHAAAGGVGLILCQWAKALGATVIGTVGSEEKAKLAQENGCDHVINYSNDDFVSKVLEITENRKVDVVYDSVGNDTFPGSLDCLKPLGTWVTFGQSSGVVPPFDVGILAKKGSLYATRPTLFNYIASTEDLNETAQDLFDVIGSGKVKISVNQTYSLADIVQVHKDLEARKTTGSTVMLP
ncbi:MAG: quinone oxidoreductase family protein [Methyloligellaceae bacterium]